jgi:anti-sigma factor RsiW
MDCGEAELHLLDRQRGRISDQPELARALEEHLAGCAACRAEDRAEAALSELLAARLPQHPAPFALKHVLARTWPRAEPARRAPRYSWLVAPALALILALVLLPRGAPPQIAEEAVVAHLRLVSGERPIQIESSEYHQVKPWFTGKLDFAPVVAFTGDADFPLIGGAVSPFLDRQAATFVFHRRRHTISLFVLRSEGLPRGDGAALLRGFNTLIWRAGDLEYALISDLDPKELRTLADRIAGR